MTRRIWKDAVVHDAWFYGDGMSIKRCYVLYGDAVSFNTETPLPTNCLMCLAREKWR